MKEIKLTQGYVALVDDDDFAYLDQFNWSIVRGAYKIYARRHSHVTGKESGKYKTKHVKMHREVLSRSSGPGSIVGLDVDHINGNGLDNRKENIRACTRSQNMKNVRLRKSNTSGYKGVSWHIREKRWIAYTTVDGKVERIGAFETSLAAARAYDAFVSAAHGEFASLNLGAT